MVNEPVEGPPHISPEDAREWVAATLHRRRIRMAEHLRETGRGQLWMVKPRGMPMSGWFRPDWLDGAQARVYASRKLASFGADMAGIAFMAEAAGRGWSTADIAEQVPAAVVVEVRRLPHFVRECEMVDREVVPLHHSTFAPGCGCLLQAGLIGGSLATVVAAWLGDLAAAGMTAAAALLGLATLYGFWWWSESSDADARAVCLCGLPAKNPSDQP